jgi:hypothetical protein
VTDIVQGEAAGEDISAEVQELIELELESRDTY